MGINVKDFTGNWYVKWVDGEDPFLHKDWKIVLGTNTDGAREPFLSPEYQVLMGFAILSRDGDGGWTPVFGTQDQNQQPLDLLFSDGTLRWIGSYQGKPLRIYISLCEAETAGGGRSLSLYGSTVFGDPDQVGVWGANDRPPGG